MNPRSFPWRSHAQDKLPALRWAIEEIPATLDLDAFCVELETISGHPARDTRHMLLCELELKARVPSFRSDFVDSWIAKQSPKIGAWMLLQLLRKVWKQKCPRRPDVLAMIEAAEHRVNGKDFILPKDPDSSDSSIPGQMISVLYKIAALILSTSRLNASFYFYQSFIGIANFYPITREDHELCFRAIHTFPVTEIR